MILKCKMCGGDMELAADKTFGTCEYCGSTMTLPKVDNDEQRAAAFNRGNHFRRIGEFDKALAVYERIVRENDQDAEAHWCCALCRFGIEYVEDPATYEYLPTCHRASFDSFLEDVDYLAALEHSDGVTRRQYQKDAAKIAEVQRGILATSQNAEPYDVFICYKESDADGQRTRDSLMAQDIYYQLTEQGRKVFFARITLEDVAGTEYEPYIFAALNSAKVMIVVGTKAEHLNAVWVKNEWSRFLAMMKKDRSKLLLPCYRDMDPYDMPEQLSVLQSYDMAKIGFIQDLTRGIAKVLDAERKPEPAREPVVVQQTSGNAVALLKRGNMALEDGEWQKADEFFEEVLNQDAECAEAYLGKALAAEKCRNLDEFVSMRMGDADRCKPESIELPQNKARIQEIVERYTLPDYLEAWMLHSEFKHTPAYASRLSAFQKRLGAEENYWSSHKLLSRAFQFARGDVAKKFADAKERVMQHIRGLIEQEEISLDDRKYVALAQHEKALDVSESRCKARYEEAERKKNNNYQILIAVARNSNDEMRLEETAKALDAMGDYSDAPAMAQLCRDRIQELRDKRAKEEEARRKAEEERKAKTYENLVFVAKNETDPQRLEENARHLDALGDFREAKAMAQHCRNRAKEIRDQRDKEERERKLKAELARAAAESRRNQRRNIAIALAVVLVMGICLFFYVIVPAVKLSNARKLMAAGEFAQAAQMFKELDKGNLYRDAMFASAEELLEEGKPIEVICICNDLRNYVGAEELRWEAWQQVARRKTMDTNLVHSAAVRNDGTVVLNSDEIDFLLELDMYEVQDWTDIISVAVGVDHTLGLKADGTVVAAGNNFRSQCNVSGWTDIVAIAAGDSFSLGLAADGTVMFTGNNWNNLSDVISWKWEAATSPDKLIVDIAAGNDHMLALMGDGTVRGKGSNAEGQCNVSNWKDVVAISANENESVGLTSQGEILFAGEYAERGEDYSEKNWVYAHAGDGYVLGLRADGTVGIVYNGYPKTLKPYEDDLASWTDIAALASHNYHTLALKSDGTVVSFGSHYESADNVSHWSDIRMPTPGWLERQAGLGG